jgi:thymidylate synthase (FAD)
VKGVVVVAQVRLVAWTHFEAPADVDWSTDADGGQALAEFAGRACYQAWDKPRASTATNAGYLRHILEVGHLSVIEHATASFYITGVSRALTHELIRHRHFSFSQLSPRFDPEGVIEPASIAADPESHKRFVAATEAGFEAYHDLIALLGNDRQARQVAQSVLPAAAETRIVVTGNYRAWRHFIGVRATDHADVEIRTLAVECLRQLRAHAPNAFSDFAISTLGDGTPIAASPFVAEG